MKIFDQWKLYRYDIHDFEPKVKIEIRKGQYIVKTVTERSELIQALRLRYDVFFRELQGSKRPRGYDVDGYDAICDHLVILHAATNSVVGTYRLNSSPEYYSANEFHLRTLLETPGLKLELGRACVQKEFRTGIIMSLLWRGVAAYLNAIDAQFLFGCASVQTKNARVSALIYRYLEEQGSVSRDYVCPPTMDYHFPNLAEWSQKFSLHALTPAERSEAEGLIPSLLRSYLRSGAKIAGLPAYDSDFGCVDFLTVLSKENLNRALWKKYEIKQSEVPSTCEISATL